MKKLILLFILIFSCIYTAKSQETESNNITIITAPGAYDDGFNIGVQYEYQLSYIVYAGAELFYFPNLNDNTYTHVIARFGLNTEFGNPVGNKWRLYGGFRGGRIFRELNSGTYALLGVEAGIQLTFTNKMYLKTFYSNDWKTDSAIWNEDSHRVSAVFIGLGIRF